MLGPLGAQRGKQNRVPYHVEGRSIPAHFHPPIPRDHSLAVSRRSKENAKLKQLLESKEQENVRLAKENPNSFADQFFNPDAENEEKIATLQRQVAEQKQQLEAQKAAAEKAAAETAAREGSS